MFKNKLTSPKNLAIKGCSAGGAIVGYIINNYPDICRACILDRPFVNVLKSLLDESNPYRMTDIAEWGDPSIRE